MGAVRRGLYNPATAPLVVPCLDPHTTLYVLIGGVVVCVFMIVCAVCVCCVCVCAVCCVCVLCVTVYVYVCRYTGGDVDTHRQKNREHTHTTKACTKKSNTHMRE